MKNRRLIFAAKLGLTALLLWALYRKLSFADLSGMVASLRPGPVLAFIALLFVNTFLSALKWRLLLRKNKPIQCLNWQKLYSVLLMLLKGQGNDRVAHLLQRM